uniref:Uncharacterized protein n=1 Tax=Cucumis melo TaxID=3656 RepID=A0A9I9CFH3_CUCME
METQISRNPPPLDHSPKTHVSANPRRPTPERNRPLENHLLCETHVGVVAHYHLKTLRQ